jgi:hypothetical protein
VKESVTGRIVHFLRKDIVDEPLARATVKKPAVLLVSKVMSAYVNHGKTKQGRGTVCENHTFSERVRRG